MTASSSSSASSPEPEDGGIKIFTVVLATVVEDEASSGSATGTPFDELTRKPRKSSAAAKAAGPLIEKMKYFPDILSQQASNSFVLIQTWVPV